MAAKTWIMIGAISGLLSVALGAFAAHGLAEKLEPRLLEVFRTGAQYQMYHALALVAVGLWAVQNPTGSASVAGWAFTIGSVIFPGTLYLLAVTGTRWLGAITPIGGLSFMIGWAALAYSAFTAGK